MTIKRLIGKTVLVFEDNKNISDLLRFFFQKRGLVPRTYSDCVDAAKHALEHAPALITMDMLMPGMDGIEACLELRREGITAPILMLTSKSFGEDRTRALAAGANAFLAKPFNPAALEAAIKTLLAP